MPMICSGITRARKNEHHRDKHEDRDRTLEKSDVDRARVVGGGIEQRIEGGEPEDAHEGREQPAFLELRPFRHDLAADQRRQDRHHDHPAQAGEHHGRDLVHGEPPGDPVAGPHEGSQNQQQIGLPPQSLPERMQDFHRGRTF